MIFSLVVGHQFIHLLYLPSCNNFRHTICTTTVSEDEAYKEFMTGYIHIPSNDSADYHSVTFKQRHKHCKSWDRENERFFDEEQRNSYRLMTAEERRKPMLDLRVLGACRQMYEEAKMLIWTTNTFSFEDSTCLKMFIDGLHPTQQINLRRMHIDFTWEFYTLIEWTRLLIPSFVSKLSFLRTLHVTMDQYIEFPTWEPKNNAEDLIYLLSRMQGLPLQHVTSIIGDDIKSSGTLRYRWTIAEKREVAEGLRNRLLDPDGQEVLAAEMQAEKDKRKTRAGRRPC